MLLPQQRGLRAPQAARSSQQWWGDTSRARGGRVWSWGYSAPFPSLPTASGLLWGAHCRSTPAGQMPLLSPGHSRTWELRSVPRGTRPFRCSIDANGLAPSGHSAAASLPGLASRRTRRCCYEIAISSPFKEGITRPSRRRVSLCTETLSRRCELRGVGGSRPGLRRPGGHRARPRVTRAWGAGTP